MKKVWIKYVALAY